jgi:hypothetical protein
LFKKQKFLKNFASLHFCRKIKNDERIEFVILTIDHFLFFSKNANFKNYTILKFLIFLIQLIGLTQNVTMPE